MREISKNNKNLIQMSLSGLERSRLSLTSDWEFVRQGDFSDERFVKQVLSKHCRIDPANVFPGYLKALEQAMRDLLLDPNVDYSVLFPDEDDDDSFVFNLDSLGDPRKFFIILWEVIFLRKYPEIQQRESRAEFLSF